MVISIIRIFATTRDHNVTVPLQVAMSIVYGVCRLIKEDGIHSMKLTRRGHHTPESLHTHAYLLRTAIEVLSPPVLHVERGRELADRHRQLSRRCLALRPCSRREPAGSVLLCAGRAPKFATIVIAAISKSPREPHRRPAPGSPWSRPGRIMRSIPVVHGAIVAQPRAVQDDGRRRGLVFTGSL